jgi:hypothetical protein
LLPAGASHPLSDSEVISRSDIGGRKRSLCRVNWTYAQTQRQPFSRSERFVEYVFVATKGADFDA